MDVRRESIVEHVSVVTAPASVVGLGRPDVQSRGFQWAGATIVEVSETISGELGIEPGGGVVVRTIEPRSWAARLGLMAGDRIVVVGGRQADSIVLSGILASLEDGFTTVGVLRPTGTLLLVFTARNT